MKSYTILLFLFFSVFLHAQEGFIKAYDLGARTLFTNILLENDTIIVSGYVIPEEPPNIQGVLFAKLDTLGNLLDYTIHYDSISHNFSFWTMPTGFIKTKDNSGYLSMGSIFETPEGFIIKTDLNGNLEWSKKYDDTTTIQAFYNNIIEVEGGFLIAGEKQQIDLNIETFLLKIDYDGNKLWEHTYGTANRDDWVNNLIEVNENEYVLGGYKSVISYDWEDWYNQAYLRAVDSLGNEKWYWENVPATPVNELDDMGMRGLHLDDQGNWVYATTRGQHYLFEGVYQYTKRQAQFVIRDSNFNLIEEKIYDDLDGTRNHFLNLVLLSSGDWLGLGENNEQVENPNIAQNHVYAWMARLSSNGDSLWTRIDLSFPDTAQGTRQYLHSAVELSSGSIIAAGYFDALFQSQKDHGLLIKVNQHGCIDTIDCLPSNITYVNVPPTASDLKVYPNPVSEILYYESDQIRIWDKVELFDITGRLVKTKTQETSLSVKAQAPGVYVLRLWKDGRFWTRRVVVE